VKNNINGTEDQQRFSIFPINNLESIIHQHSISPYASVNVYGTRHIKPSFLVWKLDKFQILHE